MSTSSSQWTGELLFPITLPPGVRAVLGGHLAGALCGLVALGIPKPTSAHGMKQSPTASSRPG